MPRLITLGLLLLCLATPTAASAQDPTAPPQEPTPAPLEKPPIALFVADARGVMANFKKPPALGTALGVDAEQNFADRGFGLVVGGHVYPLRRKAFALGIGGELLLRAQGSRTAPPATADGPDGPTVTTRMTAVSPQVSMNFGRRDGYSYVSGGIGSAKLAFERKDTPFADDDPSVRTINYGGGARWFAKKHLAFSLDLRFYAIRPQDATAARPAVPRMTVMMFSAGVSVR